jgi:HSP20 family protein
MLSRIGDLENTFLLMNELGRRMAPHYAGEEFEPSWSLPKSRFYVPSAASWPRINLFDDGDNLVLKADVPGFSEQDVHVTFHENTISIAGERVVAEQAGYTVHRQERDSLKLARKVSLPCKVNPEQISASVKDGVLTVTLAKALEAQPRRITVRAE